MLMIGILAFTVQIAERLIEMGDDLEKKIGTKLKEQLKEDFEREFKVQSAVKMAYDEFKRVSLGFLGRASGITTGWQQLYFLNYGEPIHPIHYPPNTCVTLYATHLTHVSPYMLPT